MADTLTRFSDLCRLPYRDQAVWFLNGFWADPVGPAEAETVWSVVQKFVELDLLGPDKKGTAGCELDYFWSAKLLESFNQTMTALARKEALRTIDANNDGKMSLIEYFAWQHKKTVVQVVDAPQGSATPEAQRALEEAQRALRKVQIALDDCRRLAAELAQAISDLKKQEDAHANRLKLLEEKANDPTGSVVSKNKAANELQQLKAEDPLPLRKAKLTQEAALRKCQQQENKLQQELAAAQEALDRARLAARGGAPNGMLWFMQREMFEADCFLPKSKQKFDHAKPFFFDPSA